MIKQKHFIILLILLTFILFLFYNCELILYNPFYSNYSYSSKNNNNRSNIQDEDLNDESSDDESDNEDNNNEDDKNNDDDSPLEQPVFTPTNMLYRSVGKNQNNLNTLGRTVKINEGYAVFDGDLADDIGVGDVLQYQVESTFYVAFITERTNSTEYTVHAYDGSKPEVCPAGTIVEIYRVFNSLWAWESQDIGNVNPSIDPSVANDVLLPGTDLVTDNTIAVVACYADGIDDTSVVIDGWTTGADNYIKIYTPTSTDEVGTSQRHNGKWDTNAYIIKEDDGYDSCIEVNENYVRIEGLQAEIVNPIGYIDSCYYFTGLNDENAEIHISHCIAWLSSKAEENQWHDGIIADGNETSNLVLKAWNNIVYGFHGTSSDGGAGIGFAGKEAYYYNNTVYNCRYGYWKDFLSIVIVKNNIAQGCTDGFYASSSSYDAASENNISDVAEDALEVYVTQSTPTLIDPGNGDCRLSPTDTEAKDQGVDLSDDSDLSFTDDINGDTRSGSWDIGADEYVP